MMIIMFIESCETMVYDDHNLIEDSYAVPRHFMAGDEIEVERIDELDEGMVKLILAEGSECEVHSDFFVRVN